MLVHHSAHDTTNRGLAPIGRRENGVARSSSMSVEHAKGRFIATKLGAYALSRSGLPAKRNILKAPSLTMLAALGADSSIAQDPPAFVDHRATHIQAVMHNDGKGAQAGHELSTSDYRQNAAWHAGPHGDQDNHYHAEVKGWSQGADFASLSGAGREATE